MAKTSMIERDKKRIKLNEKYHKKRLELKKIISGISSTEDEKAIAVVELQKLPRDSSRTRQRNRCYKCGRPRGFNERTGFCRIHFREAVNRGIVPGAHKASW